MDKSILNTLNPGEKFLDVKELYLGRNGSTLTYEVTLYTCKKFLFTKHISKYKYPFYFASKELINEFFKQIDTFTIGNDGKLRIYLNGFNKPHYRFYFCNASKSDYEWPLQNGEIWYGKITGFYENEHTSSYSSYTFNINDMIELEKKSAKENTYGETYLYKLQQI